MGEFNRYPPGIQIDIADGSPTAAHAMASMGPATVAAVLAAAPSMKVDVHLAVAHPLKLIQAFADAGAHRITFQFEAAIGPDFDTSSPSPLPHVSPEASKRAEAIAAAIARAGMKAFAYPLLCNLTTRDEHLNERSLTLGATCLLHHITASAL